MLFNILMFLIIVIAFWMLSKIVARIMTRAIRRADTKVPEILKELGVRIVANMILLLGILIGLSQLGIHVGPVLAGLGVAGFIVGFALQDTLSNFAAGMMILVYQPFDVGDVIEAAGVGGQVKQMSLVSTTILTFDHERLVVQPASVERCHPQQDLRTTPSGRPDIRDRPAGPGGPRRDDLHGHHEATPACPRRPAAGDTSQRPE